LEGRQRSKQKGHADLRKRTADEGAEPACPNPETPYRLTERELTVLYLLSEGLSDKQIALALGVTNYTVNKHVGAILTKMDARSRTAAAVLAIRQHLFDDKESRGRRTRHRSAGRDPYGPFI
jgi:DNA-binding NarL/FixJ family response regulator